MKQEIVQWLKSLPLEDGVVAALSGGPDSVVMLLMLLKARKERPFPLVVAHVHHGLRDTADADATFCQQLAEKHGLVYVEERADVPALAESWGVSFETAGRRVRQRFYKDVMAEHGCAYVATGHHGEDQGETILQHIIRGTGIEGLIGMKRQDEHLLRPLLPYRKTDILDYLHKKRQDYCIDETNASDAYGRNYFRHHVMPKLEEMNPNVYSALNTLSQNAEDAKILLQADAERYLATCVVEPDEILLPLSFEQEIPAFRRNILRACMVKLKGDKEGILRLHTEEVDKLVERPSGRQKTLHGLLIAKTQSGILLKKEHNEILEPITIDGAGEYNFGKWSLTVTKTQSSPRQEGHTVLYMTQTLLRQSVLRTRQEGDWIQPFGMDGKKSVARLMKDEKLRLDQRDTWPVLAIENEVIWVPFMKVSERTRRGDASADYRIEIKEDMNNA